MVGLSLGVFGAAPAGADPDDKVAKDLIHLLCDFEEIQDAVALEYGVEANRGQCQKALRGEFLADG